jgi:predicted PolB exonuclease-like 3'-5' exonuclease
VSFGDRIAELKPQRVTFNGSSFDLPVLRYRATGNDASAPGRPLAGGRSIARPNDAIVPAF